MNVIHCDLKILNICLHREQIEGQIMTSKIKIIDFGLAHSMEGGKAIMNYKCGSRGYMAPEIVNSREDIEKGGRGISITPAIDMWAFGIILYEMCVAYCPTRIQPLFGRHEMNVKTIFVKSDWSGRSSFIKDLIE